MAKGSAFARMIGLTRSLSPLGFDRSHDESNPARSNGDEAKSTGAAGLLEGSTDSSALTILADGGDAFPHSPLDGEPAETPQSPPQAATDGAAVVVTFPAVARVTVVAVETEAARVRANDALASVEVTQALTDAIAFESLSEPAGASAPPAADNSDSLEAAITAEAISAIEADIAILLSSLDREDLEGDAPDLRNDRDDDDDAQVGELLSELDRLWQAGSAVASSRSF